MTSTNDDLDALFDNEDTDENFNLGNDLSENEEKENNESLQELIDLMEKEDEINEEDEVKEDSNKLEEEYLALQMKMKELEDKMRKNSTSPSSKEKADAGSTSPARKTSDTSSSFLAAFGNATFAAETKSPSPTKKRKDFAAPFTENIKRPAKCSLSNDEVPPQKKRRMAHEQNDKPNQNTGHPFTENLRNGPSTQSFQNQVSKKLQGQVQKKTKPVANEPCVVEIERFSRIRLKKCFVSGEEMKERMQNKRFLRLSLIRSTMKISEDTDWVTVGVVAKQMERQTAKNGKPFSIWNLTDLDDCTKTVSFFLFGKVHEQLSRKMTVSSVIGILNPSIMPPKKDETSNSFDNTPALTVDVAERVMHIGISTDLGWCTATKWRNKQPAGKCLAFINKQVSDVCVFHMKSKYKKMGSKRSELQGSAAAPIAQKYKDTMWNKVKNDQFFYGGKVYSASPSFMSNSGTPKQKEPKVKLSKFLSNHAGLAEEGKKELMEKSKVMKALSGIEEDHSVSGCSPAFADMLSSGDNVAGSRQYLNHLKKMQKEEEEKKKGPEFKSITPAELLKQQKAMIQAKKQALQQEKLRNAQQQSASSPKPKQTMSLLSKLQQSAAGKSPLSRPGPTPSMSPAEMRRKTAEMIKAKKLELSLKGSNSPNLKPPGPKLGQGLSDDSDDIDLFGDWLASKKRLPLQETAEMKKKKAIAKLRDDSGNVSITKEDPNKGVLRQIKSIQNNDKAKERILGKVAENRSDLQENKENIEEDNAKSTALAKGKMSKEEFEKILNTHSSHSHAVEEAQIEENEKYFNPLIRKEMMEKKMAETFEVSCKAVTCQECSYTFWAPHDRCKQLQHHLHWQSVKKKFFECSQCKHRTTTWETYPSRPCRECGSEKNWHRTSMLKERDVKILDAEVLLIRGLEHGKFLNSLA